MRLVDRLGPSSPKDRVLVGIAIASLLAQAVLYVAPLPEATHDRLVDTGWLWAALFALFCCARAARRLPAGPRRTGWWWLALGCGVYLAAQAYWSVATVARPLGSPGTPNYAFLAVYPCLLAGVWNLLRMHPSRRLDPESFLDTLLLTFTALALGAEFMVLPRLHAGTPVPRLLLVVGYAAGGTAFIWLVLIELLRRPVLPPRPERLAILALALLSLVDILFGVMSLPYTKYDDRLLDFLWHASFLVLAAAAVFVRASQHPVQPSGGATAGTAARVAALLVGIGGITAIGIAGAIRHQPAPELAVLLTIGGVIIVGRMLYSLRADRRYAHVLEHEVAAQTNSLMDSLAAAAATERNLRILMEAVPDAILVLDRDGRILDLNAAAGAMVAAPTPQQPGRSVFELLEGDALRVTRENLAIAFEGEVRRFEVPFRRGDGTRGLTSVLYAPVREAGRVTRVLALARDITDQRRTATQLQQAEKLAALGQLVSGVAHEINNPAAIISGFAQTLMLDELSPDQREMVKMVYDEATRIGRITANLLAFARAGGRERTLVDLNDLLRRTFALRSYHLSTLNIQVALELDPSDPHVWGNGSELQQMILNLLINAEQALTLTAGKRTITLRTAANETEIHFACADTGPGIAAEVRPRIFDPFFTTKPEGVGTGLGLSICYGIVNDHGGRITVESEPGHGAAFHVTLPREPRTELRPALQPPARFPDSAPLSVLLIEDEAGLRQAMARYLNRRGVQVRAVGEGAAALEAIRTQDFDVIVTDVRMPGMSGREFLDRVRAARPELATRVVFSTGDTFAPDTAALLRDSGARAIVKPFDLAALERLMREVAAAASASP